MAHVLVVDDDDDIRATLQLLLEDAGYSVREAPDAETCLALLRASADPMVVLLDLLMPAYNGLVVLEQAQAEAGLLARHAFILMTANSRTMLANAAPLLQALSVSVLRKPFDLDVVLEMVARATKRLAY